MINIGIIGFKPSVNIAFRAQKALNYKCILALRAVNGPSVKCVFEEMDPKGLKNKCVLSLLDAKVPKDKRFFALRKKKVLNYKCVFARLAVNGPSVIPFYRKNGSKNVNYISFPALFGYEKLKTQYFHSPRRRKSIK